MSRTATRVETDSLGPIEVPSERLWGAQTERSRRNFSISTERMPREVIGALALVKKAAAEINVELGELDPAMGRAIESAADEILDGKLWDEFPLSVWQTGSGTQTNMNVNEVLAIRATQLLGSNPSREHLVHPNDHVNRGQSSNDVFPTAMALAALDALTQRVLPELEALQATLSERQSAFSDVVKIGRTHLMDATPLTMGQEIGGWAAQIEQGRRHLETALPHLSELSIGGTAVGTGLNAPPGFAERMAERLSDLSGHRLVSAPNKFEALSAHDALVFAHGALKTVAASLAKIANDVRWLASGPRSGIGELRIPKNEPGSSIMPGKVNPTQAEALFMACVQVLGNDVSINLAGASGNLQLNTCKPLMIHAFLQSARLLADGARSFREHCASGLEPNRERIRRHLEESLMLVTALVPHLGYDAAAHIAQRAEAEGTTLREAALASGLVSAEDFDQWVRPEAMLGR